MTHKFRILLFASFWMLIHTVAQGDSARPEFLKLPDAILLNQDGRPVDLEQDLLHGRIVAIQFIYTRCTLVCPVLGYQFASLQKALGERAGREVRLISISVDPLHDTPEKLAAWAERYGSGPGWTQLTGESTAIDAVLKAFEAFSPDVEDHSALLLIGDPDRGLWQRLNGTTPIDQIMNAIDRFNTGNPRKQTPPNNTRLDAQTRSDLRR